MKLGLQHLQDGGSDTFLVIYQDGPSPNPGLDVVLSHPTKSGAMRALADWFDLQEKEKEI